MSRKSWPVVVLVLLAWSGAQFGRAAPAPAEVPKELLRARLEAAQQVYDLNKRTFAASPRAVRFADLPLWSERWLQAQLALAGTKAERIAAFEAHLVRMKDIERVVKQLSEVGLTGPRDVAAAAYHRADAEVQFLQAGGQLPAKDRSTAVGKEQLPPPKP
jgi:hypothetical protein